MRDDIVSELMRQSAGFTPSVVSGMILLRTAWIMAAAGLDTGSSPEARLHGGAMMDVC